MLEHFLLIEGRVCVCDMSVEWVLYCIGMGSLHMDYVSHDLNYLYD